MPQSTIEFLLEFIWLPIVTGLVFLWHRMTGLNTRTALLEQAERFYQDQRIEDRETQEKRFSMVMKKLDGMEQRIKNGG